MDGRTANGCPPKTLNGRVIMARPRKIVDTDKLGRKLTGALSDAWWRWKANSGSKEDDEEDVETSPVIVDNDAIIIYTKQNLKINLEPMAYYTYPNGEEAFQYKVEEGSKEHKEIFALLKLNSSHEKKPARKKRITKAEKLAQEVVGAGKKKQRRSRKS
jgi:hypothetical protein